jgi:hypothetical protein
MTQVFSPLPADFTDSTPSLTSHAARHNAEDAALNVLRLAEQRGIVNAELPPFNAVPDDYYMDGVSIGTLSVSVTGTASTDIITATGNNYVEGAAVTFSSLTGGAGLTNGTVYYARDVGTNGTGTFKVAATFGGTAIDFTTNITAGTVAGASSYFSSATASFTGADVGKNIMIVRAGDSSEQDRHTTIASVVNSTTVTLTNAAGRPQALARFYVSRAGGQATAINAAITECSNRGGGICLLPGPGYLADATIILQNRVVLMGAGLMATCLHLGAAVNAPVVMNDQTYNNSAYNCGVANLWIDGNKQRQTSGGYVATGNLTSAYTAGVSNQVVIGSTTAATANFLNAGRLRIGNSAPYNIAIYYHKDAIPGGTVTPAPGTFYGGGGWENTTDVDAGVNIAVAQNKCHGIHFAPNPAVPQSSSAPIYLYTDTYDPFFLIFNVLVKNVAGDGISNYGQSAMSIIASRTVYTEECGFRPSFDSYLLNCSAQYSGRFGFYIRGSQSRIVGGISFYNGQTVPSEGWGYFFEGPRSLETGNRIGVGIQAQDNKAEGIYARNAQRCLISGTCDSNSSHSLTTFAVTGDATTNIITATGHPFQNGQSVTFAGLAGGAGLSNNQVYYARDVATNTFTVATAPGGAVIDFTTAITAGTVAATYAAIKLDGATNCIVDVLSVDRGAQGAGVTPTQVDGLDMKATTFTPVNNQIRLNHAYAEAAVGQTPVARPLKPGSVVTGGNNITLNGMGGIVGRTTAITGVAATDVITATSHGFSDTDQVYLSGLAGGAGLSNNTIYFVRSSTTNTFQLALTSGGAAINFTTDITAGTVTPAVYAADPYNAETHQLTLYGATTIAAPVNAHLGTALTYVLTQDATGGRVVTFNAALPAVWGPSLAPGAVNVISFVYNGTAWIQTSPDPGAPITKVLTTADVTNSTVTAAP